MAAERRGRRAESLCVLWLRLTGWRILARRLKAPAGSGLGEIDIVAKRGKVVAFIEVKARAGHAVARAAISPRQRARIVRAAHVFAERHADCGSCAFRFDVMSVGRGLIPQRLADAWRPGDA
jgi:putative endonuclease